MITVFHGDNLSDSRKAFFQSIDQFPNCDLLHLNSKSINLDQVNNFLNGASLFPGTKVLAIDNLFSLTKSTFDQFIKLINPQSVEIILWQDKTLAANQIKIFPQAKYFVFKADNQIFSCLRAIKPHNLKTFCKLYDQVIDRGFFDLFLYLLKSQLRRQLQTYSQYSPALIQKIYLQAIELEYQYKSGQLSLPRELALKRVLLPLVK